MRSSTPHIPVLTDEILIILKNSDGYQLRTFLDATVGGGGHSAAILHAHPQIENYIAVDRDLEALQLAEKRLIESSALPQNSQFFNTNFSKAPLLINQCNLKCDAILIDLGVSSMQLQSPERGFSFWGDAPLDMRMNQEDDLTAAKLINSSPRKKLEDLLKSLEVKNAHRIVEAIVQQRNRSPILTTKQLIEIARPHLPRKSKAHPATLLFQALRIVVNDELDPLDNSLKTLAGCLAPQGRLAVISFHSLEDRIVKTAFRDLCAGKLYYSMTKKPITASAQESQFNRKSRSAKLRAIVRES